MVILTLKAGLLMNGLFTPVSANGCRESDLVQTSGSDYSVPLIVRPNFFSICGASNGEWSRKDLKFELFVFLIEIEERETFVIRT